MKSSLSPGGNKPPKPERRVPGLCFRCEHRARHLEGDHGPRFECQQPASTCGSCYMFTPVLPPVLARAPGQPRWRKLNMPSMFRARSIAAGYARPVYHVGREPAFELTLVAGRKRGTYLLAWLPLVVRKTGQLS